MENYKELRKRVTTIEYKLGIGYIKTSDDPYKILRILNSVFIAYLFIMNTITLTSFFMRYKYQNEIKVSKTAFAFLIVGTVIEVAGAVLNYFKYNIIANVMNILPLFYFTYVYTQTCQNPDGLWGYLKQFYYRYAISYVLILILAAIMLYIAIRQQVRTRKLYKRIVNKLYASYVKKKDGDTLSVNDDEWDDFVRNFDPRKDNI